MRGFSFSVSFGTGSFLKIIPLLILCILGFCIVHALKMMRMYLIVMEKHVPTGRFIGAYLRTTLVNLLIPYKLGEIYRVGVFSRISGDFPTGLFSVLTDRFFDTLALIIILLPYQILSRSGVSISVAVLTIFLLLLIFGYMMFPSSYRYLNRYIIMHRTSKRSMGALKSLEIVNEWYLYVKELITGRYGLIMLFSFGAWIVEFIVLMGIAAMFGISFSVSEFGKYISSILSGSSFGLERAYTVFSVVLIIIACIVYAIWSGANRKKELKNEKSHSNI